MGNKGSNSRQGNEVSNQSKVGDVETQSRIERQVAEALEKALDVSPLLAERQRFGGLIRQRTAADDAVDGIDDAAVQAVFDVVHERTKLQTAMMVARQKQIHLVIKGCSDTCEEVRNRFYKEGESFSVDASALSRIGELNGLVQRACDQVFACLERCNQIADLLPPEDRPEPFRLPTASEAISN